MGAESGSARLNKTTKINIHNGKDERLRSADLKFSSKLNQGRQRVRLHNPWDEIQVGYSMSHSIVGISKVQTTLMAPVFMTETSLSNPAGQP